MDNVDTQIGNLEDLRNLEIEDDQDKIRQRIQERKALNDRLNIDEEFKKRYIESQILSKEKEVLQSFGINGLTPDQASEEVDKILGRNSESPKSEFANFESPNSESPNFESTKSLKSGNSKKIETLETQLSDLNDEFNTTKKSGKKRVYNFYNCTVNFS